MNLEVDVTWLEPRFPALFDLRPIGRGGQKLVIAARHQSGGDVVLKLINPNSDPEMVRREILAVKAVASPRVPRILDEGTIVTPFGTCVWLLEERIEGNTVRQLLTAGPLAPQQVLRLGIQTLEALAMAEAAKKVHRDVKPDNLMCDPGGNFWLLDFGIARHLDLSSMTATASPFGKMTLGYAPPEQCRNVKNDIDSRADLFALGVTLHECASGKNAFFDPRPRDQLEILRRVERFVLPPLMLPIAEAESFRDFINTMTQKSRTHRPRTVAEAFDWIGEICRANGVN